MTHAARTLAALLSVASLSVTSLPARAATTLVAPIDVAVGPDGTLFVADAGLEAVLAFDTATGDGSVVAGVPAGGLGVGPDGDLYVAAGNEVWRVDAAAGPTLVAGGGPYAEEQGDGGPALGAWLDARDVVVDRFGDLYVTSGSIPLPDPPYWDARVRRVDAAGGTISTVFRDLSNGTYVAIDLLDRVYVTNRGYHDCCTYSGVLRGSLRGTHWSEVTGGMCPPCQPNTGRVPQPLAFWLAWEEDLAGIVVAPAGTIWVAAGTTVRRADGEAIVYTVAGEPGTPGCSGDGGPAADALLSEVGGLALDAGGNLFVADSGNASVRRIDALTGTITTVAGTPC